jgi:hypothetical protein
MKREQIIEILKEHSLDLKVHGEMFKNDSPEKYLWEAQFNKVADAIMALPIETPSDEEIKNYFTKEHYHYEKGRYTKVDKDRIYGAKWMRDEIIKRNK